LRRPATSLYAIDLARNFSKVNPVAFQLYWSRLEMCSSINFRRNFWKVPFEKPPGLEWILLLLARVLASCNYWEDFSKVSPDLERIAKAEIIPMHDRTAIILWKSLGGSAAS
jgi:hypothetical protein